MTDRAEELHAVLRTAGEKEPYVLLGHSYGGFLVRLFATSHPKEVVGMVLVDAAEEGVFFAPASIQRWSVIGPELGALYDKAQTPDLKNYYGAIVDELASNKLVPEEMRKPGGFGRLGNLPLVVIAHSKPFTGEDAVLEPLWRTGEERLAALSTHGKLIVASNSDHNIQTTEPDLIVDAVKAVIVSAKGGRL